MVFHAFRDVGWLFLQEGEKAKAIILFEILVDVYPDKAESYRRLGEAHMENNDHEAALTHLRKALELNPDYGAVKQMLQRLGD